MKIGIIGSGIVGRTLGTAFIKEGHEVMVGSRDPLKEELVTWKNENSKGLTGNFADTAVYGDIILLATAGHAVLEAVELAGRNNFSSKVVIDATNPIAAAPPVNAVLQFFTDQNESLMEKLQKTLPEARLVKAFNSVGNTLMYKPDFNNQLPTMFICGNDPAAKRTVTGILEKFGWEVEDMGAVEAARPIESLCVLWCITGFIENDWYHAFKLLKK